MAAWRSYVAFGHFLVLNVGNGGMIHNFWSSHSPTTFSTSFQDILGIFRVQIEYWNHQLTYCRVFFRPKESIQLPSAGVFSRRYIIEGTMPKTRAQRLNWALITQWYLGFNIFFLRSPVFICIKSGWWFGTWILFFHSVGNVIIPTDFNSIIFQMGRSITNQITINDH